MDAEEVARLKHEKELLERQLNEVAAECDRLQVCVGGGKCGKKDKCGEGGVKLKHEKELLERQLEAVAAECDRLQVRVGGGKCGQESVGGRESVGREVWGLSMRRSCWSDS